MVCKSTNKKKFRKEIFLGKKIVTQQIVIFNSDEN